MMTSCWHWLPDYGVPCVLWQNATVSGILCWCVLSLIVSKCTIACLYNVLTCNSDINKFSNEQYCLRIIQECPRISCLNTMCYRKYAVNFWFYYSYLHSIPGSQLIFKQHKRIKDHTIYMERFWCEVLATWKIVRATGHLEGDTCTCTTFEQHILTCITNLLGHLQILLIWIGWKSLIRLTSNY